MIHGTPLIDGPTAKEIATLRLTRGGVLAPQGRMSLTTIQDPGTHKFMTDVIQEHYSAINEGIQILYVFGEVRYLDIADRPHTTRYCMYAVKVQGPPNPAWKLANCNKFNEMD